jgi:YidC/Oxa1 family membrane protein insertase
MDFILSFFHEVFFRPILNLLIFYYEVVPFNDLGISIILTTFSLRFLLLPITIRASLSRAKRKELNEKKKQLQERFKMAPEYLQKKLKQINKEYKFSPGLVFLNILIQIPMFIMMYQVNRAIFSEDSFDMSDVYPAVTENFEVPARLSTDFLGIFDLSDITGTSIGIIFVVLYVVVNYFLIKSLPLPEIPENASEQQKAIFQTMKQMRYINPIMIATIPLGLPSGLALYLLNNSIFTFTQNKLVIQRK